jgi:hypothetical protein
VREVLGNDPSAASLPEHGDDVVPDRQRSLRDVRDARRGQRGQEPPSDRDPGAAPPVGHVAVEHTTRTAPATGYRHPVLGAGFSIVQFFVVFVLVLGILWFFFGRT